MKNALAVVFVLCLMLSGVFFGGSPASKTYSKLNNDIQMEIYTTVKPESLESLTAVPYYIIKTNVADREEIINKLTEEGISSVGESVILNGYSYSDKNKILKMFEIKIYETVNLNGLIVLESKNAQVAFSNNCVKVGFPRILGSF